MPNRIIKESICTSDSIDGLDWFSEVLFYRLIVNCDDFGRFDGRVAIIKNRLFPLKDNLTAKTVSGAIEKLASAGLVTLYVFEGKPYLYLPTWYHHQSKRASFSKYPDPEGCDVLSPSAINCLQLKSSASNCNQMQANVPVFENREYDIRESRIENARESAREGAHKPTMAKYGLYGNVLLSEEDYNKLTTEFPSDYAERIDRLSEYIASTGKKYKNHLATIRSWARKDAEKRPSSKKGGNVFLEIAQEEGIV